MIPPCSCTVPGKKPGTSTNVTIGMLNAVAETDEARRLDAGVDVEHAGQHGWLVRDDAHRATVEPRVADEDVARPVLHDLQELAVVHDLADDLVHVVGLVRLLGDHTLQRLIGAQRVVVRAHDGRVLHVVGGQVAQQLLDQEDGVLLAIGREMSHAAEWTRGSARRPTPRTDTCSCVTVFTTSGPVTNI